MVRKDLGDSVEWIDVSTELNKHKTEKIYYKTDHHWTTLGAFYAFQAAAPSLGIEGDLSGKYVSYAVSDSFNGMLASKSGVNLGEKEQIDIYVPTEEDTDLIVDYVDEGKRSTSLYDSSKLKEKESVSVFLGGNSSLLDIRTVSTSTKRLLLVKDSFANSFIPFLNAVLQRNRKLWIRDITAERSMILWIPTESQRFCFYTAEIHFSKTII